MASGHSTLSSSPQAGRAGSNCSLLFPRFLLCSYYSHLDVFSTSGLLFCFVGDSYPCKLHSQTPLPVTFDKGSAKVDTVGAWVGMHWREDWLLSLFLVLLRPFSSVVSLVVMGFLCGSPLSCTSHTDFSHPSQALRIPPLQWSLTVTQAVQFPAWFSSCLSRGPLMK